VFAGPTPPSFEGYDKDQTKLLVDYILQLTPDELRRVGAAMGHGPSASAGPLSSEKAAGHKSAK